MADRYSDLVLEIHAAASDPAAWTSVVEKIRVALHARGAMLHTPQVSFLEDYWCFHSQFETSQIESYARDWMAHDAWAEGARQRGLYSPERIISVDDALIERRSFRKTAFFQEYLRPNDVDRMVTVNLHRSRNQHRVTHVQLSVFRGLNKERFSSEDVKPLEQLRPHLLVATRNHCSLRSLLAFNATTEHALDSLAAALFAIDRDGRLVYSNRPGDEVLKDGAWLSAAGNKLSHGTNLRHVASCASAIRDLIEGIGRTLILEHASTGRQRILLTTPLGRAAALTVPVPPSAAGLVWLLPDGTETTVIERIAKLFELTPAESRLLEHLACDNDLKTAAEILGISIHTARNEIKGILRKTGRRSQAQLLALLNRLAGILAR
ncbi:MAG: helix-turn-helix transcriptional regulator [Gammaproteobacteria bacterium]